MRSEKNWHVHSWPLREIVSELEKPVEKEISVPIAKIPRIYIERGEYKIKDFNLPSHDHFVNKPLSDARLTKTFEMYKKISNDYNFPNPIIGFDHQLGIPTSIELTQGGMIGLNNSGEYRFENVYDMAGSIALMHMVGVSFVERLVDERYKIPFIEKKFTGYASRFLHADRQAMNPSLPDKIITLGNPNEDFLEAAEIPDQFGSALAALVFKQGVLKEARLEDGARYYLLPSDIADNTEYLRYYGMNVEKPEQALSLHGLVAFFGNKQ